MELTAQNKKYLTYGGVSVLLVGIYFAFFSKPNNGGGSVDPTGNGTNPDAGDVNGFNAHNVATNLYLAMKDTGTDSKAIVRILTNVTNSQFPLVVKAFGSLPYNKTLGNQYGVPGFPLDRYPLKVWLYEELDDSDYRILKLKYPNYL